MQFRAREPIYIMTTIEYSDQYQWYAVYEFGRYPRSSVLAGQTRKSFLDSFESLEAAQAAYPDADVGYVPAGNSFGHLPDGDDLEEYERDCLRREQY